MSVTKLRTYKNIFDWVLTQARQPVLTPNADTLDEVKASITSRYDIVTASGIPWRWRRDERRLKIIGKVETGTVSVINDNRQVTFSALTLDDTFVNRGFKVSGDEERYKIISVNIAGGTAMLDERYQGTTNATASYKVFKNEYGMWPDLEELISPRMSRRRERPHLVGPDIIYDFMNRFPNREGKTRAISLDGLMGYDSGVTMGQFVMGFDFMGGTDTEVKKLIIWPHIPDEDFTIPITYVKRVPPLVNNGDQPLMPPEDRIVLGLGALSDLYETLGDDIGATRYEQRFQDKLDQMVSDNEDTDDLPQFVVPDFYRRNDLNDLLPVGVDFGHLFDIDP